MSQIVQEDSLFNRFDYANSDFELSQLKYHLILRKVNILQGQFSTFARYLYEGFLGVQLQREAITTIQIVESFDMNLYDIICGFKKDSEAMKVYQNAMYFVYNNAQAEIQLAQAFRMVLEFKCITLSKASIPHIKKIHGGISQNQSPRKRLKIEDTQYRPQKQQQIIKPRQIWAGKLWAIYSPNDLQKQVLQSRLAESMRCAKRDISIQQLKDEIPHLLIYLRTQALLNSIVSGTRATEGVLLILREDEVQMHGLKQAIRQRQLKAIRSTSVYSENHFNELCRQLLSFRQFNLRVVAVAPHEGNFIVVTQNQVQGILKFLRIPNWRFEAVSQYVHINPPAIDFWNSFQSVYRPL